jgi:predicted anti-sigma-YlaC factor YlaD
MSDAQDLSCAELVELVTDYLEGAISDAERARIEAHLDICEGCRNYLQQFEITIAATGRLTEEEVPPEAISPLMEAFREAKEKRTG